MLLCCSFLQFLLFLLHSVATSNFSMFTWHLHSIAEETNQLLRQVLDRMTVHSPTENPADIARKGIAEIKITHQDFVFSPVEEGDGVPFLTVAQLQELVQCPDEAAVVAFMTPLLNTLFAGLSVIVNSESLAWLATGGAKQKPDLFVCPKWVYDARKLDDSSGRRFGIISDTRLYDTAQILDCKCTLAGAAFGELIIHMQHLNTFRDPKLSRGMLFGKNEFYLATVQGTSLVYRMVGQWSDRGAGAAIRNFFEPLPWDGASGICNHLGFTVPEPTEQFPCAFLGAGGNGRVLRVKSPNGGDAALKVSLIANRVVLRREFELLSHHNKSCGCTLVVQPVSNFLQDDEVCGYAMTPVGFSCVKRRELTDRFVSRVIDALYRLHAHNPVIVHGDPRLPNLIQRSQGANELFWIDFAGGSLPAYLPGAAIKDDIVILVRSILDKPSEPLSDALMESIVSCAELVEQQRYISLTTAINAIRPRNLA